MVKLVRILFLVPLLAVISGGMSLRGAGGIEGRSGLVRTMRRSVPWFVAGFVVLALVNTLGWLGDAAGILSDGGKLAIVVVVAAIGLSLRLRRLVDLGRKTFITGLRRQHHSRSRLVSTDMAARRS